MPSRPKSVLFVCSENALRSPMAEGIVKARYGDKIYVDSVGVRGGEIDPLAVAVMAEIGIDISRPNAKRLEDLLDTSLDLIVPLSPAAHHLALELTRTQAGELVTSPTYHPSRLDTSPADRVTAAT